MINENENWIIKALAYGLDWWVDDSLLCMTEEPYTGEHERVGYYSQDGQTLVNETGDRAYSFKISIKKDFYNFYKLAALDNAVKKHQWIRKTGERHFHEAHERLINLVDDMFEITFDEVNLSQKEIDAIIQNDIRTYQVPAEIINKIVA